ncbi:hypothetical protein PSTG_10016 [Puccinia striiformis f. sp. tritici PST-78]|uniref:Uncharacterized protein n=1 Tax=Puccinia striiformis f. sp. tritici PST-78 TaxID=1165861 RepID=A0A0L0VBU9_9BASI|nr:hypothetical protein PSTG_10016 [Puccinia striiformis f. sp. tritici PST-78]
MPLPNSTQSNSKLPTQLSSSVLPFAMNSSFNFQSTTVPNPPDDLDANAEPKHRKRHRANKMTNYWARQETTAGSSCVDDSANLESTEDDNVEETITAASVSPSKKIYYYYVPKHCQHDPNPLKIFTTQQTLLNSYHKLDHGTCIIAPKKEPGFCKFKITPFSNMSPQQLQGRETLVMFFWSKPTSWTKLAAKIRKSQYNAQDKEAAYWEANKWIATHLQELAPQAFKEYCQA